MKHLLSLLLLAVALCSHAQTNSPLRFDKQGKFKIVQFTDVHFKYGNPASDVALECIDRVLDAEHPDLVIFTGDVIYKAPADTAMRTVLQRVAMRKIPFAVTLGNHDAEQNLTNVQLYDVITSLPGCIQPRGKMEYALPVASSDGKRDAAVLYVLDSHDYSSLPDVKGYAWIEAPQIAWYREQSNAFAARNGGTPLPALAFFHIPLPEYGEAASDQGAILRGTRMEGVAAPKLNSGMFTAMKEQGDVMGCFVGHDHDNDYAVMWKGILLAYGRFTGGNTEYNHLPNGARVIVLDEGSRTFSTWIRQRTGEVEQQTRFPDSYVKDDWRKRGSMK